MSLPNTTRMIANYVRVYPEVPDSKRHGLREGTN